MENTPEPGDKVVHAVHGPGEVVGVQTRQTADGPKEYVSIDIGDMRVLVPLTELEDVGIREPISKDEAREILALLSEDPLKDPGHAGRRRRNEKRLVAGETGELAKVVRSLRALKEDRDSPLKYRDKVHLEEATDKLVSELSIALGVSTDEARELVNEAVADD